MLCAAAFGAYRWLNPLRLLSGCRSGSDGMVISGTKIMMRQPRLTGYTSDERPYTVIARTAAQDITKPDMLELAGHPREDGHAGQAAMSR